MKTLFKPFLFLLFTITLLSCEKEVFEPKYQTDFNITIKQNDFVDTLYYVSLVDVSSGNDRLIENGTIKVEYKNQVLFDDHWEKLLNMSFSFSERQLLSLKCSLFDGANIIEVQNVTIDNRLYPNFVKISKINVDYDLTQINYNTTAFSNLIEVYSFLYSSNFQGQVSYYHKFFQPYLNTYLPNNMLIPLKDKQSDQEWMSYYISVKYPTGIGNTFLGYELFDIQFKMEDVIDNNHLDPNLTYQISDYYAGAIITIDYKPIYNE